MSLPPGRHGGPWSAGDPNHIPFLKGQLPHALRLEVEQRQCLDAGGVELLLPFAVEEELLHQRPPKPVDQQRSSYRTQQKQNPPQTPPPCVLHLIYSFLCEL